MAGRCRPVLDFRGLEDRAALPDDESGGEGNLDAPASSAGGAMAVAELEGNIGEARED